MTIALNKKQWDEMRDVLKLALSQEFNYNVHPREAATVFRNEAKFYRARLKQLQYKFDEIDGMITDVMPETVEI